MSNNESESKVWFVFAIIGMILGVIVGFDGAGLGGAILGVILGGVIGFLAGCLITGTVSYISPGANPTDFVGAFKNLAFFVGILAAVVLVILFITGLWGVGRK